MPYLAPEAVGFMLGKVANPLFKVEPSLDAYALGAIACQLLARSPFSPFSKQVWQQCVPWCSVGRFGMACLGWMCLSFPLAAPALLISRMQIGIITSRSF